MTRPFPKTTRKTVAKAAVLSLLLVSLAALWRPAPSAAQSQENEDLIFSTNPSADARAAEKAVEALEESAPAQESALEPEPAANPETEPVAPEEPSVPEEPSDDESVKEIDVLIDTRHAHDFSDCPLTLEDRNYHRIYSFNRAFERLKSRGVRVERYESDAPLDAELLARCKTLFLNLPSGDKEPFLLSELVDISNFIKSGGSAFFIVDHTNCYFHQSRLKPLFNELDIEPQFYGVCDMNQALGSGYGWIYLDKFSPSPVTQNLRQIAFQTGGGVDPRDAVVWSGDKSWRDAPNMPVYGEADLAYYGNFLPDKGERVGSNGCVLAKEFGRGKIVVVGDQNLFSAFFLQYLDNYRLWLNSFAWLLDRPELADPQTYLKNVVSDDAILCWEELAPFARRFGNPDQEGYYNLYASLCRRYDPFCVANDDSELGLSANVLLLLNSGSDASQTTLEVAYKQLAQGKTAIFLDPPEDAIQNDELLPAKLLKRLGENGVERAKAPDAPQSDSNPAPRKYVERIDLSNGGTLILQRGRKSFSNADVPAPEATVLMLQQANLNALLQTIDSAMSEKRDENKSNN
ncbi:MAG: hypothetical protein IJM30_09070 [Thermoguttaceae bacterium]|nr:hypothetical protein [Thermoguttaceae bacterium]